MNSKIDGLKYFFINFISSDHIKNLGFLNLDFINKIDLFI